MTPGLHDAYLSPFDAYCEGARDPSRYVIALNASAAKVPAKFSHAGSLILDGTCAFDLAEIAEMDLGQLNLIRVSSFCGPQGLVWGLDVAEHEALRLKEWFRVGEGAGVPVHDGRPLIDAAAALFGTVEKRRFPIAPGSHTRAAYKSVTSRGPVRLYAASSIGIPIDRERSAATLMEDAGTLPPGLSDSEVETWRLKIAKGLAESVLEIFANQKGACKEIFVVFSSIEVDENEVGCAISVVPYFTLAKRAEAGLRGNPSLREWVENLP